VVKVPHKTTERNLLASGYDRIIGVDEVGMGCLAGPVVVCAISVSPEFYTTKHPLLSGLRDSKLLSPAQRARLCAELERIAGLEWRVASCDAPEIDTLNIYQASRTAMRRAIAELGVTGNPVVLVDGNKKIHGIDTPQLSIVKGDQKIWAIAAASVIAKVYRDQLMDQYARTHPQYGFEIHKGYSTKLHRDALQAHGPCPLHRRSFRGVLTGETR
jgi:ribonuclease HII